MALWSTSQSATTFDLPDAIASRRMFRPHQPEPMSAVRYARWGLRIPRNGAAARVAPLAMKRRRDRSMARFPLTGAQADELPVAAAAIDPSVGDDRRRPPLAGREGHPQGRPEPVGRGGP